MPIETASFISQLVGTNPAGADDYATADDHIRLLKNVLQGQFPNFTAAAMTSSVAELNKLTGLAATPTELGYLVGVTSAIQTQLNGKAALAHVHDTADITTGTLADARIAQTNVTQHQAALALATAQIVSGTFADARVAATNVTQHIASILASLLTVDGAGSGLDADLVDGQHASAFAAASHAHAAGDVTSGTFADARIAQTNVTQHQAALALAASQTTSGIFAHARLGRDPKHKTIDTSRNTTTTPTADPHLAGWSLEANAMYMIDGFLWAEEAGATPDIRFDWAYSGTLANSAWRLDAIAANDTGALERFRDSLTAAVMAVTLTGTVKVGMTVRGFVWTTAVGTLDFRWAQNVSDAANTTLKQGSWINITKVA